jgi:sugar-phosphatase
MIRPLSRKRDRVRCAVLFDVDGVLVDSSAAYRRAWDRWAAVHCLDPGLVWGATYGRRVVETVRAVAPWLNTDQEYHRLLGYLDEEKGPFPLYPGAADLLTSLPGDSWAIVTSGRAQAVSQRLADGGAPIPSVLVDGSEVTRGEPDPQGYLLAAHRIGAAPSDCLVVQDAPAGIRAGLAAGMQVLALATTHPVQALRHADHVLSSLTDAAPQIRAWLEQPSGRG